MTLCCSAIILNPILTIQLTSPQFHFTLGQSTLPLFQLLASCAGIPLASQSTNSFLQLRSNFHKSRNRFVMSQCDVKRLLYPSGSILTQMGWGRPRGNFVGFPGFLFVICLYSKTHKARSSNHAESVRAPTFLIILFFFLRFVFF